LRDAPFTPLLRAIPNQQACAGREHKEVPHPPQFLPLGKTLGLGPSTNSAQSTWRTADSEIKKKSDVLRGSSDKAMGRLRGKETAQHH